MATDAYRVSGKIKAACRSVRAMARRPVYRNIVCPVRSLGRWLRARGVDRREFRYVVGCGFGRYDGVPRTWRFGARLSHLVEHLLYRLYAASLTVVPAVDR
jgi:hypothetical protein